MNTDTDGTIPVFYDFSGTDKFFDFLAESIQNTFSSISNFVNDLIDYSNKNRFCGQGVVFRSIGYWFLSDKLKFLQSFKKLFCKIISKRILFFRKTNKATKQPIRFHGWIGGR